MKFIACFLVRGINVSSYFSPPGRGGKNEKIKQVCCTWEKADETPTFNG
jgi:hypothetical protein